MASTSPRLSSFPISSSRVTRQLPAPSLSCTTLPLPSASLYQTRQPSLSNEPTLYTSHYGGGDYFTPTHSNPPSIPSSAASTPAPSSSSTLGRPDSPQPSRLSTRTTTTTKRASISSLLSSPNSSSSVNDSSSASASSSPTYNNWSGNSSPTTAGTTRSNSVVNTPVLNGMSGVNTCFSPVDYDLTPRAENMYADQDEDTKMYTHTVETPRKKARSTHRAGNLAGDGTSRDEYDVLGRKKPKTPRTPMSWDPKDDILLKQLKEEQRLGWKEIATHFRGRTSHACQFRWRRLASGQLKYYQGHRRPPPVTTTAASFANEMANSAGTTISTSPKVLMSGMHSQATPRGVLHQIQHAPIDASLPPMHHHMHHQQQQQQQQQQHHIPPLYHHQQQVQQQQNWGQSASIYQPTPLPSPTAFPPRFLVDDGWSEEEDELLLNRKLSFDEVNVLLHTRTENEIWNRQNKLRQSVELHRAQQQQQAMMEGRRVESYEERIPSIGSLATLNYHSR